MSLLFRFLCLTGRNDSGEENVPLDLTRGESHHRDHKEHLINVFLK